MHYQTAQWVSVKTREHAAMNTYIYESLYGATARQLHKPMKSSD